ncbi:MAG: hypothetical protein QOE52_4129 [Mycobacterium sp.]|jgi:nucleoside 2-deoxyribosyltransferase|nr:hypothetical protein [Mycobacterium sp.]MDT7769250.1 hypothetical protein [Mycobacterium sp.]
MTRRKVVVVLPYGGGGSGVERRKAILNFSRLKYIVENKCQVVPPLPSPQGARVDYDVEVAKTATDEINRIALERIRSADILIALLSERNQTVAYELGYYRRGRERTVILMVDTQDDVLPVYEKLFAHQEWRQDDVLKEIDSVAGKDFIPLDWDVDIPVGLKEVIDARDHELIKNLTAALQEIEQNFGVWWFPDAVEMLRGILSQKITRFYPFSVVEVSYSKKGEFEDPELPAKVVDFDEAFSRLYGYADKTAALRDKPHTLGRLLDRLKRYSEPDDWEEFSEEQNTLTDIVVKNYGIAHASVPIKINSSHPDAGFKDVALLPCMAAQVIDGDLNMPHHMYLLIVYIGINNGTLRLSTRGEG